SQRKTDSDGRVHGIASVLQNSESDIGGNRLLRDDHAVPRGDRRLRGSRRSGKQHNRKQRAKPCHKGAKPHNEASLAAVLRSEELLGVRTEAGSELPARTINR